METVIEFGFYAVMVGIWAVSSYVGWRYLDKMADGE